jgi:glycosyltransferase involved in cell wall biosynthesis
MSDRAGITVVIPAYGSGPHLEKAVAALRNQSPPVSCIVISHSGEGDPTSRFAGQPGVTVLHSEERLYAGAARNRGLALVKTEWVAFLDEDMIADPGWHAALQDAIARGAADCIVGSIGSAASGGYWGTSLWFAELGSAHPYLSPRPLSAGPSGNLTVRRDAISAIGGFPGDWPGGEELVMQSRLRERGYSIRFEPSVQAGHINLPGFLYTLKHNYPLGRGSAELRVLFPHFRGSWAVRWPVLSLGLWIAFMTQLYLRVFLAPKGPRTTLVYHTPGILMAVLAWNLGFASVAFSKRHAKHLLASRAALHSAEMR